MSLPAIGSDDQTAATAKAMVYYQAAMMVEPRNFLAANELGVLWARVGQWQDARQVLQHGVTVQPNPALWRNLAAVHRRLGEEQLARLAENEWRLAVQQERATGSVAGLDDGNGFLRWVLPQNFSQSLGADTAVPQTRPSPEMPSPAPPEGLPVTRLPSSTIFSAWLPWSSAERH
jgi:hypothetical protein